MSKTLLVKGEIIFDDVVAFSGATIYVRLMDVSKMDVASRVITQQVIRKVIYDPASPRKIIFALYGEVPDNRARYTITVHVDRGHDGKIKTGDFINMESYPVLTQGYSNYVTVHVKQVK